jgi:hypothetical protein
MSFPTQTDVGIDTDMRLSRTRTLALAGVIGPLWFTTCVVDKGCSCRTI